MKNCRVTLFQFVAACIGAAGLTLGLSQLAFAVDGVDNKADVFQMEGNATDDNATTVCFGLDLNGAPATADAPCPSIGGPWTVVDFAARTDDWSNIFTNSGNFAARSFTTDPTNTRNDTSFLGTASKDTDDLFEWTWNQSKPQAKADIAHAFAGAYLSNETGNTFIYAGMDRIANNGSTTAGFWFIQDSGFAMCTGDGTDTDGDNPTCTTAGTFIGQHTNGDLLLVSDFSNGGAVSTINVFIWNSGLPSTPDASRSPAPCDPVSDDSDLCGLVNNKYVESTNNKGDPILEKVTVPTGGWSFSGKGGNTAYLTGEFLEIGIDLNSIFGANVPCFSKFMGETRSSTSVSASLSDLTAPVSFPLCSISVTKTCNSSVIAPKAGGGELVRYSFSGNVNNTGNLTIYKPQVKDTVPTTGYITGSLKINSTSVTPGAWFEINNGGILGGNSAPYSGTLDSSSILMGTADAVKNFMDASASSDPSGTPQNVSGEATADWGNPTSCAPIVTPGLTLAKKCQTCLVTNGTDLDVDVSEGVKICNTGNVTISGIVMKDCRGGTWSSNDPTTATCSGTGLTVTNAPTSLGPGQCQVVSNKYTPADCGSRPTNNCSFGDAVIAGGTASLSGGSVNAQQTSTACSVCPINNTCPTYTNGNWGSL